MADLTKPCIKCGMVERHEKEGFCIPCQKARKAAYYQKNKDALIEKNRKWQAENREKTAVYTQNWRNNNPDYVNPISPNRNNVAKVWREKNREAYRNYKKEWAEKNKDKISIYLKKYAEKNKDKMIEKWRINKSRRRALKAGSNAKLSNDIRQKLMVLQQGKCACCSQKLSKDAHLDHIMPLALGGENADSNMQLLLPLCNMRKNAKHPIDYMRQKGFLL